MSDHDRAATGFDRRQFFKLTAATGVVAALPQAVTASPAAAEATRLSGLDYTAKFSQPLRRPERVDLTGARSAAVLRCSQFRQQVLEGYPPTELYGYGVVGGRTSWPGPTMVARARRTARVEFQNKLPTGGTSLADGGHLLPVDRTLLDADLLALPAGEKPLVTHLHGSHVEWESDGYPEAWATQRGRHGAFWRKAVHVYDNSQGGGTLWYHDHTVGITRLNVYAGLAGMYLLRDETERALVAGGVLPADAYETELVIQDRWFTDDGQLFMQTQPDPENGIDRSVFGDFVLVNGTPWPVMEVEPRKYRLRLLNASDSRFYVLSLSNGAPLLVVGSELSLLPRAVEVTRLPLAPGERYDVVVDLSQMPQGTEVLLSNPSVDGAFRGFRSGTTVTNRPTDTAFGFGGPVNAATTGQVMKFRVSRPLSSAPDASVAADTALGPDLPPLTPTRTRGVLTFNGFDGLGRGMEMLGSLEAGTSMWSDPVTEVVDKGTTEMWEIYNTGPVAHPIHIHLVDFEVLDRASFTWTQETMAMEGGATGAMITVTDVGARRAPEPFELGRKDTVICYPGEVTRVVANFDRAGNYIWHCHILHHEDHDMMRPLVVR